MATKTGFRQQGAGRSILPEAFDLLAISILRRRPPSESAVTGERSSAALPMSPFRSSNVGRSPPTAPHALGILAHRA